ncbi:hypothetical protein OED52_04240 [Rhodococcus sp. Z13]|uniref:Uncharacterized protein n=1 Tax=Rhodococcus sacchari TaxID=2962047 RepID=A0ACD4DIF0_9NOCA|nr:hypothetical protein [Rhodococcus sp. Z13]UYP19774.1 hypothetical protein OED52_04240 [Rhodococcus sp. Z13]
MPIDHHFDYTSGEPWEIRRRAVENLRHQRREYALRRAAEEAEKQSQQRR